MFHVARLLAAIAVLVVASAAQAQQSIRVSGTVESFDGRHLTLTSDKLGTVTVELRDNPAIFAVSKAALADLKPGDFVGVGGTPLPDGSQRAIQVTIFSESQRGAGEGFRPWDRRPNGTMTNATVAETVARVDGKVLTVKYKGGEKTIVVPPGAVILAYSAGNASELKPGAHVAVPRAVKQPDGSLHADRVNVGRGDVVPK